MRRHRLFHLIRNHPPRKLSQNPLGHKSSDVESLNHAPQIFFPRSIANEAGYRAKTISPQTSAKPPSIEAPGEYYHDHQQAHDFHNPSNPISMLDGPATPGSAGYRMNAFRFPQSSPHGNKGQHLDPTVLIIERRDSMDSGDLSLAYDSDGEVLPMTKSGVNTPATPHHHQGHPIRHAQSQPGYRRRGSLSKTGTKSDDTVWEETSGAGANPGSSLTSSQTLRRHNSDGPSMYNRGKVRVSSASDTLEVSAAQLREQQTRRERPVSQLHPYVSLGLQTLHILMLMDACAFFSIHSSFSISRRLLT